MTGWAIIIRLISTSSLQRIFAVTEDKKSNLVFLWQKGICSGNWTQTSMTEILVWELMVKSYPAWHICSEIDLVCCHTILVFPIFIMFFCYLPTLRGFCGSGKTWGPWSRGQVTIFWATELQSLFQKEIRDCWHLGKMFMLTAIISLLEVSLLASLLVKTEHFDPLLKCLFNRTIYLNRVGDWSLWSFHLTLK